MTTKLAPSIDVKQDVNAAIIDEMANCYADPLRFTLVSYPWQTSGTILENFKGPDADQAEFFRQLGEEVRSRRFNGRDPVAPIRFARSSGRSTGKTARLAMTQNWIMSTRKGAQGTVTANNNHQLQTKTWAAIRAWASMCITSHWFETTTQRMTHKSFPAEWFCTPQSCKEENADAFLGQHALTSTQFYIFDEASSISDKIFTAALSGMKDGEPMMFVFGNPTRRTGLLYRSCFGSEKSKWNNGVIDSRNSAFANKVEIAKEIEEYGENSSYARVWIAGLPPSAEDLQFIDADRVWGAQKRDPFSLPDDPLIVGVDVSRGGKDPTVFRFRKGRDARTIPPIEIPGEMTKDSMQLAAKIVEVSNTKFNGQAPDAVFVDATGLGGPIVDRCKQIGGARKIIGVMFSQQSPEQRYANYRAYMWSKCKDWLDGGSIDDNRSGCGMKLEEALTGPSFSENSKDRIVLESKDSMQRRGLDSCDHADALCLTFAYPVTSSWRKPQSSNKNNPHQRGVSPWG